MVAVATAAACHRRPPEPVPGRPAAALTNASRVAALSTAPPVAARPLIQNPAGRRARSLSGAWRAIVDPYESGYYDYRLRPQEKDGYFANRKPSSKTDRVEYDFDRSDTLAVPGDWNSQRKELFFYEGTVW
ncbi:MAG: hypothetical protein JOZ69_02910 [Myxococcales bacterium]|nr:hypothetical protein [Myxococcales bacterium]